MDALRLLELSASPAAMYWTAGVIGLSLILWIGFQRTRVKEAVAWVAVALAGQACTLQLLEVGPQIRLQLFYEWRRLLGSYRAVFLFALLLQATLVIRGASRFWPVMKSAGPKLLSWRQALAFLVLEAYAAITIHPGVAQALVHGGFADQAARHVTKIALALLINGVGALNLFLATASLPADTWEAVMAWWRRAERRWLPWCCALWVVIVSSLLAWLVLDRMPHVPDEVAYIFQAKYIATGHLYLPPPPDVEAFECRFSLVEGGKWYGAMLGGWPFALAIGYLVNLPWLVNPLLGGIAILLAHLLVRRLYSREVADGTALLLAASPWLLFMSASLMPHAASLVFTLIGLLGIERARNAGGALWAAAAGLSFGALLHIRPLEAAGIALAAGLWWLSSGWRRLRLAALASTLVAGLAMTGLFLAYNKTLTGNPWLAPVNHYFDKTVYPGSNRLGFGPDVGNFGWTGLDALPGHGPIDVVMNTNQNLYLVNFELFGWSCGSLLLVFLLLVWREVRSDGLLWGLLSCVWAAMSLYWFSGGPDFGARYWYQLIFPLAVLTVRGAAKTAERLSESSAGRQAGARVWALVALASLLGLVNVVPWRSLDKYPNYRGQRPDIRELERTYHFGRSLVLVRGKPWPDYSSAFPFNPAQIDRDAPGPIYARDLGPESNERLRDYFADRPVWIVAGPSETGNRFRVVQGPLPPKTSQGPPARGSGTPR